MGVGHRRAARVRAAAAGGIGSVRLVSPHAPVDGRARALASGAGRYLARIKSFPDLDAALLLAGLAGILIENFLRDETLPQRAPALLAHLKETAISRLLT